MASVLISTLADVRTQPHSLYSPEDVSRGHERGHAAMFVLTRRHVCVDGISVNDHPGYTTVQGSTQARGPVTGCQDNGSQEEQETGEIERNEKRISCDKRING